jgi:S-adenosylmethionine decarboxylase
MIIDPAPIPAAGDNYSAQQGCFEGPEKLLEIWFSPSPHNLSRHQSIDDYFDPNGTDTEFDPSEPASPNGTLYGDAFGYTFQTGLRVVPKDVWDDMLAIVKCTVLSVMNNDNADAYLLR